MINRCFVKPLLPFVLFLLSVSVFAQIQITFPLNRMVFQRDNANFATIPITGTYKQATDLIQARVVPIQGGSQTSWQTVQSNPQGGWYAGSISASGGWYQLEVRGLLNGNVVFTADIPKVGIGEVFLIAGQSNARGYYNYGSVNAVDDRVNSVDYINSDDIAQFPQPSFTHLDANSQISPQGLSSWCWAPLGDRIAARYNVPVLFYNVGREGLPVKNWRESVDGGLALNPYTGLYLQNGVPYTNMRSSLHYYASMTGLRAILWSQGEGDNYFSTPFADYVNDLKLVISKSREHFNQNISWVVCRQSVSYNIPSSTVISAQNNVISTTPNVFAGPALDRLQIPRPDNNHFQNSGLTDAAIAWNNALDNNFFNNSNPIRGQYPTITASCSGSNQLNLTVPSNYTVVWNGSNTNNSIGLNPGVHSAQIKDAFGNIYFVPNFEVAPDLTPAQPSIWIDGTLQLCPGSTVGLISNLSQDFSWSNGATTPRIDVGVGNYSLVSKNKYNCTATTSVNVAQVATPAPPAPTISNSGPLSFCLGGQVTLTSSSSPNGYRWSDGSQSQSITVNSSGTYQVKAVDSEGCTSQPTQVTVTVNSLPNAPSITSQSSVEFCQGGSVTVSSSVVSGNTWSTGEQSRDITIKTSGSYTVRIKDSNGCEAESNTITVKVNPLPAKPTITPERPTTFCQGDNTSLVASNANQYNWSNGQTTSRINITNAGSYSLTVTDSKGCTSAISDAVIVVVNSLPTTPTISANQIPVICQNESVVLTSNFQQKYVWSNGETTQSITVRDGNNYSVRVLDANNCFSPFSNVIKLVVNPLPPKPTITPTNGSATVCQGQIVTLRTNNSSGNTWSTFESSQEITTSTTGQFTVKYKDNNGCESTSEPLVVTVNGLPPAPRINVDRPATFCSGDYTALTIPLSPSVYDFKWSTNETSSSIQVRNQGVVTAKVTAVSTGCTSPNSDPVNVVVNPNPNAPTVTTSGPTEICADQNTMLTADEPTATSYLWSNQVNAKTVNINQQGSYTVQAVNQFGCTSAPTNPIFIKVNPSPDTPTIIVEGPTAFCDGGQVGLRVESLFEIGWNTNEITDRIVATKTGNYAARIKDGKGCYSAFSAVVRVDVKPLPPTPLVSQVGLLNLEVANPTSNATYSWTYNGQNLTETSSVLRAKNSGKYQVKSAVKYSNTLTCFSLASAIIDFIPSISANGLGVYPSPVANGVISIETADDLQNADVSIYSAAGRIMKIYNVPLFNSKNDFDISILPPGTYIVEVSAAGGYHATKKILVL